MGARPRLGVTMLALLAGCGRLGFDPAADPPVPGALVITDVQPRYLMPDGGELVVTLAGEVEGVTIELDGQPCTELDRPTTTELRCAAPPHDASIVPLVATNDAGDTDELAGGFVYLTPGWYQAGGPLDDRTSGIATGPDGSIFVSGATNGALDGPGAGDYDVLLVKYDAAGRLAWMRQLGTPQWEYARDVAVDPATGDAVVVGYGSGDLDGDGQTAGGDDLFLARYAPDGTRRWVRQLGTPASDEAWDVAIDAAGNAYVSGWTSGTFPGATAAGGLDYLLLKVRPDGTLDWVRQAGTAADDHGHSLTVAADGTAYLVGYTGGVIEPGGMLAGGDDVFVARYEADGTRTWIRQRGTAADDRAQDAALDAQGRPVVVGFTAGALDGNPSAGGNDLFVMRFSTQGAWELTRQRGSAGNENTWGVAVGHDGRIHVSCVTNGAFDGETSAGGQDLCLVTWQADGTHLYTRLAGSPASDSPSSCAFDLARTGLVYISLVTDGGLDGRPSRGQTDAAVAKFDPAGNLR